MGSRAVKQGGCQWYASCWCSMVGAVLRWSVLFLSVAAFGCGADATSARENPEEIPDATARSVDIGVPAGDDGLSFESLPPGGALRLQTFGQGGTHVMIGVRTTGFGTRAFVATTLRNLDTGAEVLAPAPVRPQLFICDDARVCDLVPLLVMTAGLTETGTERDGVPIEVRADVHDAAGVEASATREALLSTEDL
jgi:hypothetical protein